MAEPGGKLPRRGAHLVFVLCVWLGGAGRFSFRRRTEDIFALKTGQLQLLPTSQNHYSSR